MTKNDRMHFAKVLGGIAIGAGREINEVVIGVYFEALQDFSIEDIDQAGKRLMETWDKPGMLPTPAQFRQTIQGDPKSRSHEALELLMRAMERSGSYKSVSFQDQSLIVAIEHYGGWPEICAEVRELRSQDQSYWEHNFREVYQSAFRMSRKPRKAYLEGVFERHNSENAGSFTRGKLLSPEVEFYGIGGMVQVLALEEFNEHSKLVEASRKQLTETTE